MSETSPSRVFNNLMHRPLDNLSPFEVQSRRSRVVLGDEVRIGKHDLLKLKRFLVADQTFITEGLDDAGWVLFATACCPNFASIMFQGSQKDLNLQKYSAMLSPGDVIIVDESLTIEDK